MTFIAFVLFFLGLLIATALAEILMLYAEREGNRKMMAGINNYKKALLK